MALREKKSNGEPSAGENSIEVLLQISASSPAHIACFPVIVSPQTAFPRPIVA